MSIVKLHFRLAIFVRWWTKSSENSNTYRKERGKEKSVQSHSDKAMAGVFLGPAAMVLLLNKRTKHTLWELVVTPNLYVTRRSLLSTQV